MSPSPHLTDEQRRAITARGVSVALSAGAGCGKTFVLTERFLACLEPGPSPSPPAADARRAAVGPVDGHYVHRAGRPADARADPRRLHPAAARSPGGAGRALAPHDPRAGRRADQHDPCVLRRAAAGPRRRGPLGPAVPRAGSGRNRNAALRADRPGAARAAGPPRRSGPGAGCRVRPGRPERAGRDGPAAAGRAAGDRLGAVAQRDGRGPGGPLGGVLAERHAAADRGPARRLCPRSDNCWPRCGRDCPATRSCGSGANCWPSGSPDWPKPAIRPRRWPRSARPPACKAGAGKKPGPARRPTRASAMPPNGSARRSTGWRRKPSSIRRRPGAAADRLGPAPCGRRRGHGLPAGKRSTGGAGFRRPADSSPGPARRAGRRNGPPAAGRPDQALDGRRIPGHRPLAGRVW